MKKHINGALSFTDAVQFLEPFLIYTDDLTYQQYREITKFLTEKISNYNKIIVERGRAFSSLKTIRILDKIQHQKSLALSITTHTICNILTDATLKEEVFTEGYECQQQYTNSEILNKMLKKDSTILFSSALALETSKLMISSNMAALFNESSDKKDGDESSCKTYTLAKQYTSQEDLETDNDKEIYFDKRFDKTRYSILDEPDLQKQMAKLSAEDFIDYLVANLQKKEKLSAEDAMYLADTLITGAKKVVDGQHAFIFDIANLENLTYYKRVNNRWTLDDTVDKTFFINDSDMMCNVQKDCIEVNSKCESIDNNKFTLKQNTMNEMMTEFDAKYALSKEEMEAKIKREFDYNLIMLEKLKIIEHQQMFQYNDEQYKLGFSLSSSSSEGDIRSVMVSPFASLRDLILGQQDFVKKQNDIIKFTLEFTRESNNGISVGSDESPHWRYCIKTNVKLLPIFLYTMASYFVNDPDNYNKQVEYLIKDIGTLSDDGDSWVDKHSGYVIKAIDFDVEEGYEDGGSGFKIKSREILEQDAAMLVKAPKLDTPEIRTCSNIITTFATSMGIKLEEQREMIIKFVSTALEQALPSEAVYKKQVQEIMKKGKTTSQPSYKDLYNSTILYLTMGMILIAIQASIPGVKSRKTFPGCVRSFHGYPIEGAGDDSALTYISCVAYKIRSPIEPWNVLQKRKEIFIAERIKDAIQKYFLGNAEIIRKFEEKTEYLLVNKVADIPEEHNIVQWKQFLPPLVPIKLQHLTNITSEFKSKLLRDLKTGYKGQFESLDVVQSKVIFFSLRLQEKIQKIVEKEKPLLTNMANEAFMENACCNMGDFKKTIDYFVQKDEEIATCNKIVGELMNTLDDVVMLSKASMLFSSLNTKNIYPSVIGEFSEQTIYKAFINFCNFTNPIPVSEDLISLCNEKPAYLSTSRAKSESIQEIIQKLKNDGKVYTNEMFLRLLQIVGRNHEVKISLETPIVAQVQQIRDIIEILDKEDDDVIDASLRNLIEETLDTFDLAIEKDTKEMRDLKNHLARTNESMRVEVIEFIQKYSTLGQTNVTNVVSLLNNLMRWGSDVQDDDELIEKNKDDDDKDDKDDKDSISMSISDEQGYNSIQFTKSYLQNFIQTFPNIIINEVDYETIKIPKYWGLSQFHIADVMNLVTDYYKDLRKFYNNKSLEMVLSSIQTKGEHILLLGKETPYFTEIRHYMDKSDNENDKKTHFVFDKRTSMLLFEQYFLLTLLQYKYLSENENMVMGSTESRGRGRGREGEGEGEGEGEEEQLENIFDVEDLIMSNASSTPSGFISALQQQGKMQQLKTTVANMMTSFLQIMQQHKHLVSGSYEKIMDRVFKLQESEKNTFTDRLKGLTDEALKVDNVLKANKLGVWSKGLQKGLTMYDKDVYDEEREMMDKIAEVENGLKRRNIDVNETNLEDAFEDMEREKEIDAEAYDMRDMNDDYDDGNYGADEVDDVDDYE